MYVRFILTSCGNLFYSVCLVHSLAHGALFVFLISSLGSSYRLYVCQVCVDSNLHPLWVSFVFLTWLYAMHCGSAFIGFNPACVQLIALPDCPLCVRLFTLAGTVPCVLILFPYHMRHVRPGLICQLVLYHMYSVSFCSSCCVHCVWLVLFADTVSCVWFC